METIRYLILRSRVLFLGGGTDGAQKINADGTWGDLYYYLTLDGTGYVADGWYKDDFGGEAVTDADVLAVGEALIITAASDFTITCAGQVIEGVPTVSVPQGSSIVGNPTPVEVKISDITSWRWYRWCPEDQCRRNMGRSLLLSHAGWYWLCRGWMV